MIEIIAIIIALWLLGIIGVPWIVLPKLPLMTILGVSFSLKEILILLIAIWLSAKLGNPFRQIVWVFVLLWLLSFVGIVTVGGMTTILTVSIIVGLILGMVQGK